MADAVKITDPVEEFHNRIKESGKIQGVPDYQAFQSAMQDPGKRRAFYDRIQSSGVIQGLPEYERFSQLFDRAPDEGRDMSRLRKRVGDEGVQRFLDLASKRDSLRGERKRMRREVFQHYVDTGEMRGHPDRERFEGVQRELEQVEEQIKDLKPSGVGAQLVNAAASFARGASEVPAGFFSGVATTAKWLDEVTGIGSYKDKDVQELASFELAQSIRDLSERLFPTDPTLQDEFLSSALPGAIGSFLGYAGGGIATRAVRGAPAAFAAISAAMSGSGQSYEEAIEAGASEEDAQLASRWGFIPGAIQVLPVLRVLDRFNKASRGQLQEGLKKTILEAGKTGVEEALAEMAGQAGFNAIAQNIYDEERELLEGLAQAGSVGGTAGFLSDLALTILGRGAARARGRRSTSRPEGSRLREETIKDAPEGTEPATEGGIRDVEGSSEERVLSPEVRFEWRDDIPPEQQLEQLASERSRLEEERRQAEQQGQDVSDYDLILEEISRIQDQVASEGSQQGNEVQGDTDSPDQEVSPVSRETAIEILDGRYQAWQDEEGFHLVNTRTGSEVGRTSPNYRPAEAEFIARRWASIPRPDMTRLMEQSQSSDPTKAVQLSDHLFDYHDVIDMMIEQGLHEAPINPAEQDLITHFQGGTTFTADDVKSLKPDEFNESPVLRTKVARELPGRKFTKPRIAPDELADIINREHGTQLTDFDVVDLWTRFHLGQTQSGEFTDPTTRSLVAQAEELAGTTYDMGFHEALSRQRLAVEEGLDPKVVDDAYRLLESESELWFDQEGNLNYNEALQALNDIAARDPEFADYQQGLIQFEDIGAPDATSQIQALESPADRPSLAEDTGVGQEQVTPETPTERVTAVDRSDPLQDESAGPDPASQPADNQPMMQVQVAGAPILGKATPQDMAQHPVAKGQGVNPGDNYIPLVESIPASELPPSRERTRDPVRREEILAPFLQSLGVRIMEGRLPKGKYGDYMPSTGRMRIARKSDIEVVAHEVAHLLESRNPDLKKLYQRKEFREELRGISYDVSKIGEGYAEFLRLYMTQPHKAEALAPRFHKAFGRWLNKKSNANLKKAINQASEGMTSWLTQDPLDRMRSKIGYQRDVNDPQTKLRDAFRQSVIDDLHGLWLAERRVTGKKEIVGDGFYVGARLSRGASAIAGLVIEGGGLPYVDGSGNVKFRGKSLRDVFEPVAQTPEMLEDAMLYFAARRANKLLAEGRENLLTRAEIDAGLSLQNDLFDQVHAEYQAWREQLLDFAQEYGGVINPEGRESWDSLEYVPFYRVREKSLRASLNKALGRDVNPGEFNGIKRLTGGTQNLNDIFDNIMMNTKMLVEASIKNRARLEIIDGIMSSQESGQFITPQPKATVQSVISKGEIERIMRENGILAEDIGKLDDWIPFWQMGVKPRGSDLIVAMRQGRPEYYKAVDPLFYRSYAALDRSARGPVRRALNTFRRFKQMTITHTPDFLLSIGLRDTLFAWAISKNNYRPFIDTAIGYAESLKQSQTYKDYIAAGGGLGGVPSSRALRRRMERFYTDKGINWKRVLKSPADFVDLLDMVITASETATRVAEFRRGRQAGRGDRESAFESREVAVDYALQGDNTYVQFLYDSVIFLRAATVSVDRIIRGGITDTNKAQIAARVGMLSGMSVLLYMHNRGIPEYEDLEDWDKDAHWHFFIPDEQGGYHHWRYPKIWEIGAVTSMAERTLEASLQAMGLGGDAERNSTALKMIQNMYRMDLTPSVIQPLTELANNKNSFTGRMIETPYMQNLDKPYRSYTNGSRLADWVGSNVVTELPEGIQVSPAQLEHLIRGYFGTWGLYFMMGTDAIMDPQAPARELADIPGVRRLAAREVPRSTKYTQMFYELYEQMKQVQSTYTHLMDENRPEAAQKYAESEMMDWWPEAQRWQRSLSRVNAEIRELQNSRLTDLTPEEKREELNELYRERNHLVREFVKMFQEEQEP